MDKFLPVPTNQDAALPGDQNFNMIAKVEQTLARLDEIADVEVLIELQQKARALTEYFSKNEQQALTMKSAQLRIARRIGEVLAQTVRPGNPQLSKDTTIGRLPKGVSRDHSSKWKQLAEMSEELFEEYLASAQKPTLNGALKYALQGEGATERNPQEYEPDVPGREYEPEVPGEEYESEEPGAESEPEEPDAESEPAPQPKKTAKTAAEAVQRKRERVAAEEDNADSAAMYSCSDWKKLSQHQRQMVLHEPMRGTCKFNKQVSEAIDWAKWSWNPVTGCLHNCPYCYARDIAKRFYSQGFVPTFIPERLAAPGRMKVPSKAAEDVSYRNVFTCSMADLFGKWVPTEWIQAVLDQVSAHPEWNFLFLTKFPLRYREFSFPSNAWVGTTVDHQARVAAAEKAMADVDAETKWLSIEPMLTPLRFQNLEVFQWIVMGGASRSTETPEYRVPFEFWAPLQTEAMEKGIAVYHKTNLYGRTIQYPWADPESSTSPEMADYLKVKDTETIEHGEGE
jgi:protein gp37